MDIKIQIRFQAEGASWLCFRHAAKRAVEKNEAIQIDLDDYTSDYYMGSTCCADCEAESTEAENLKALQEDPDAG